MSKAFQNLFSKLGDWRPNISGMSFEKLSSDESGKPNVPFSEEEVLAASSSLSEDTASGQMVSLWYLINGLELCKT